MSLIVLLTSAVILLTFQAFELFCNLVKRKQNLNIFIYFNIVNSKRYDSPVENQNDLELDFKGFFSLLILVVEALYLMNPTDATLASLTLLKYSRWRPRWPSVRLLRLI